MKVGPSDQRLALDLGATKFAYCVSGGRTAWQPSVKQIPWLGSAENEFAAIAEFLDEDHRVFGGVPVICVAPTLQAGRVLSWPNRSYWGGFPLMDALQSVLESPVVALADGAAAALVDAGPRNDVHYISLFFGTGVAGGVVDDGDVAQLGPLNPELGHIVTNPHGEICVCGRRGCIQAGWIAFQDGRLSFGDLVREVGALLVTLSRMFPRCVVSLGGRLVTGGTATGEQLLSDLRNFVGHDAWSPEIRLSGEVSNAPLAGALLLDRESGYLVQGRLAFPGASTSDRDQFVSALQAAGVPINRAYPPLFELPAYGRTPEPGATFEQLVERCPNAVLIGQTGFSIHHRALLSGPDDLQRVAQMIDEAVQSVRKNRQ